MEKSDTWQALWEMLKAQPGDDPTTVEVSLDGMRRVADALSDNGWREPDYIFDAENWDTTYAWEDRSELADIVATEGDFEPWRFETLHKGPPVWAKNVVLTRDEYGDPDETEVRWFNSEEEARACQPCPQPPGGSE